MRFTSNASRCHGADAVLPRCILNEKEVMAPPFVSVRESVVELSYRSGFRRSMILREGVLLGPSSLYVTNGSSGSRLCTETLFVALEGTEGNYSTNKSQGLFTTRVLFGKKTRTDMDRCFVLVVFVGR